MSPPGDVVGRGAGHRNRGRVRERDLLWLGDGLVGLQKRVFGEGAVAGDHFAEDLVIHGEALHSRAYRGNDSGRLPTLTAI